MTDEPGPEVPALNWEELEEGKTGQLPLFPLTPTIAERILLSLIRSWRSTVLDLPENHPVPWKASEEALACLLIAHEWGKELTNVVFPEIYTNREMADKRILGWLDVLLWDLCIAGPLNPPDDVGYVSYLVDNLAHHDSAIRWWILLMAWIVKDWLPVERSTIQLLQNVADKIMYAGPSAGIARALYPSDESFEVVADSFRPQRASDYGDQYLSRLDDWKQEGWDSCQASCIRIENNIRRVIISRSLGLRLNAK